MCVMRAPIRCVVATIVPATRSPLDHRVSIQYRLAVHIHKPTALDPARYTVVGATFAVGVAGSFLAMTA